MKLSESNIQPPAPDQLKSILKNTSYGGIEKKDENYQTLPMEELQHRINILDKEIEKCNKEM